MDVSYLLMDLGENYPPFPLVTHSFLCTGLILFLPTPDHAPSPPIAPRPYSPPVVATVAMPPIPSLHPSPLASSPWPDPVDPVLLDLLHSLLPLHPWGRPLLGLRCLINFRAQPSELLLLASLPTACPIRPVCLESWPVACPLRQPRPAKAGQRIGSHGRRRARHGRRIGYHGWPPTRHGRRPPDQPG